MTDTVAGRSLRAMMRDRAVLAVAATREVMRHRSLRGLELSLLVNWTAEHAYLVALGVYAYAEGGALAVGLLGLGRLLPAGIVALVASAAADRYPRETILRLLYAVRSLAAVASGAAFFAGAPATMVFVLGGSVTVLSAALRPAYWALLPMLAKTPEQLAASNVLAATSEGVALLAGPVIGGLVVAAAGPGVVFVMAGQLFVVSGIAAMFVNAESRPLPVESRSAWHRTAEGVRAVARHPDTRALVLIGGAQTFVRGALTVLIVIAALDLLAIGEAGVGLLNSAFGIGNFVGAVAALAFVGRRRLGGPLLGGLLMWGVPIALIGVWPSPVAAFLLLLVPGWGNAVFDIAILTMLQRITPDEVLGRVFGILETTVFLAMAAGSIAASGLVAAFGVRGALIACGAILPVLVVLIRPKVRALDDRSEVPEQELALLRRLPLFAGLPAVALEHLASKLTPETVPRGHVVFRQGDAGDRFYVIAAGEVSVDKSHQDVATLGPGDYFGEIALLRGVPRTATVVAREESTLMALSPEDFLAAVSRYEQCARRADDEAARRMSAAGNRR